MHRIFALALLAGAAPLAAQTPAAVEQKSGTTALLQAVSPVSDKVVWVSGHGGAVLRTIDGGDTWEVKKVPDAEKLEFRDIQATSATVAWAMSAGPGGRSKIFHTTDGGTTWTLQYTNTDSAAFFDCLTFFDEKTGIVFSDAVAGRTMILRTTDGGAHWAFLPANKLPVALKDEGGFAASGGCLVNHGKKRGWIATGAPEARILRTDDAGKSWVVFPTPFVHGDGAGMTATSWLDEKRGIGVGARIGQMRTDTASAVTGVTDDGGATWTMGTRPSKAGSIFGVAWVPGAGRSTAVAAALSGLWVTTDAAATWTPVTSAAYWSVGAFGKRAWGVGPGGRITRLDF